MNDILNTQSSPVQRASVHTVQRAGIDFSVSRRDVSPGWGRRPPAFEVSSFPYRSAGDRVMKQPVRGRGVLMAEQASRPVSGLDRGGIDRAGRSRCSDLTEGETEGKGSVTRPDRGRQRLEWREERVVKPDRGRERGTKLGGTEGDRWDRIWSAGPDQSAEWTGEGESSASR